MNYVTGILKVLADKNRLRILKLLEKNKRMCVCELAFVIGITQPSVSRHLKKMKSAGVITDKQDSFWTNYLINDSLSGSIKTLLSLTLSLLDADPVITEDCEKSSRADREKLCRNE